MPDSPLDFLDVVTPQLRALLERYQQTLTPTSYDGFVRHLKRLSDGYRASLAGIEAGSERARAVHRLMNQELATSSHLANSCTRGCSACCHLEVEITKDEGELLALLVLDGHPIDFDRLKAQAARKRKSEAWERRQASENRCVFLDGTDSCGVYESRPSVCRKALVTTPAAYCSDPGQAPLPILIPLAELIISTALSLPENPFTSISKSLSEGLERFARLRDRSREIAVDSELGLDNEPFTDSRERSRPESLGE